MKIEIRELNPWELFPYHHCQSLIRRWPGRNRPETGTEAGEAAQARGPNSATSTARGPLITDKTSQLAGISYHSEIVLAQQQKTFSKTFLIRRILQTRDRKWTSFKTLLLLLLPLLDLLESLTQVNVLSIDDFQDSLLFFGDFNFIYSGDPHSYYAFAQQLTKGLTPIQQQALYQQQQMAYAGQYANTGLTGLYGNPASTGYGKCLSIKYFV